MSDENLIWGWVIPRGGKKKPVILDRDNHDEISAITEEEIHGLGYFTLYSSPASLTSELNRLREALGQIAAPRDCGCSPVCQCNTEEALRVEVDYLKDLARSALSPDNSTQKKEG